jgi:GDP-L-fucose synthase
MAAASAFVMNLPKATLDAHTQPMQNHINVGFGDDITIKELAQASRQDRRLPRRH